MIPKEIQHRHVLQAIAEVDAKGYPERRESTKYDLVYGGRRYPPKYLVSLACRYATGEELPATDYNGGAETNGFLALLGFEITTK